jgi:hypothetical protein
MEPFPAQPVSTAVQAGSKHMNSIIYIVGLVVIVIAILSFLGLT